MKINVAGRLAILCLALSTASCSQNQTYDLAITNVKVFDSKNKTVLDHRTVLINADTIAAIVEVGEDFNSRNAILGNHRLLVPGFIDTHTHLMQNYGNNENYSPETIEPKDFGLVKGLMAHHYLAHGVTSIVDMGQPETWMDVTLNWQKNPAPEYPNLFICGGSIVSDEDRRQPQHHIEVSGPEDGRRKVRTYAEKGLKHMKLYRKLRKKDMEAMVDEARKFDITINTHTDNNVVTIDEAMEIGILNFEHFFTVTPSILNYDKHWKAMNEAYGIQMSGSIDEFTAHMVFFFRYIREHPQFESRLMGLFDRMAAKGASLSTALNVLASSAGKTDFFTSFKYFPIRRSPMVSYSNEQQRQLEEAFDLMMLYVKKAHEKGVKLRIGTDCRFGGKATLHELMLFSRAGLAMEDILQIATLNGYEAMKLDDAYGTIEVGKKADMVLFEKDPFEDYKHLLSKKTIIKGGKPFSLKKSLAYDLLDVMVDEGTKAGLDWLQSARADKAYASLDSAELQNVFGELLGTGKIEEAMVVFDLFAKNFSNRPIEIEGNTLTNATYALLGRNEVQKAMEFHEFNRAHFPEATQSFALEALLETLDKGVSLGLRRFEELRKDPEYNLNEHEMNDIGYLLLQMGKMNEAITFFEMNVAAFPDSWNVYDSLGEAYALNNRHELAMKYYRRSIQLNPENNHGKEQLKKLESLN